MSDNPEACPSGLHTTVIAIHYCDKPDYIAKMHQVLTWLENDSWPAVQPVWLSLKYDNQGGGGPCAPSTFSVLVHYPPYALNPLCCKK